MRHLLGFLFLLPTFISHGFDVEARFDHSVFHAPELGSYLETYINIAGHSVKYKENESGELHAKLEITQIIKDGEDIIDFQKYELNGPTLVDSLAVDIKDQRRFSLDAGRYKVEVSIRDLNKDNAPPARFVKDIEVLDMSRGLHLSDVELLESILETTEKTEITKAGYNLIPLVDNFYPIEIEKLAFYTEIYNTNKTIGSDDKFLLKVEIENYDDMSKIDRVGSIKKMETNEVIPVLQVIDISELPTGNYHLNLKIISRSNEVLQTKKVYFTRFNPDKQALTQDLSNVDIQSTFVNLITSEDSLDMYIASTRPITSELEKRIMDKSMSEYDFTTKKQYFFKFWKSRNPNSPEDEWNRYKREVMLVDRLYSSTIKRGFETDRGRVYLRYGKPDYVEQRPNEPSSYPYETWQYYRIDKFNNRFFVFYLPDLVTNDYALLHSDMQGEVSNYRWKQELNKRNTPFQDIDAQNPIDHFGGRSGEVLDRSR
jgi:GWxTD domain-containing protein